MASIGQDENGPVDRMVEAKAAIVTGGAGGIGKSTVRRLLDSGLSVFVVDANQGALDALRSEFAGSADRLEVWRADVTDESQTIDAVSRANKRFGGIYALVHIAGGAGPKRARDIEEFQLQDWTHVIDLNLTSAFLAARAAVPLMRAQRRGRIVLFSSIIADGEKGPLTTVTGRLPYATAKAALLGFTSQLAKDLAEWGITVNALMPGLILGDQGTRIRDRFDRLEPQERAAMLARYPAGKPGSGDDIAAVVDFLLSDSAGFISGVALPVDGAYR
jgi:NAD(P)-dependent dehydrogenase (short-subunit alcohol dehydrogenase family)